MQSKFKLSFASVFLGICLVQASLKSTFAQQTYSRNFFVGTWIAQGYQCLSGKSYVEKIGIAISSQSLTATKIDSGGDACVPTGSVTFHGLVPSSVSQNSRFPITWVLGNPNRPACCSGSGSIFIIDENTFIGNPNSREQILFRRNRED